MYKSFPIGCIIYSASRCSIDSLKSILLKRSSSISASLSTSYVLQKNYQDHDYKNYLFINSVDYYYKVSSPTVRHNIKFKSDLGYLKFIDSLWSKYNDNFKFNYALTDLSAKKFVHTYALNISSQWLDTYRYTYIEGEPLHKKWRGGIFNPAVITLSYNVGFDFWQSSQIMLGLTSFKISIKPRYIGA